jgi:hypothetical protein
LGGGVADLKGMERAQANRPHGGHDVVGAMRGRPEELVITVDSEEFDWAVGV